MFRKKIKNFLLLTLISFLFLVLSNKTLLAQAQEPLFSFSLNFQKLIKDFFQKIFPQEKDVYKEKYYLLLQELAQLKLALKTLKEQELIKEWVNLKEKYLAQPVKVLKKDDFGFYYVAVFPGIKEGMIVVDQNWVLVGKVKKVFKNYALIESLEAPNLEFNVTNLEGQLLGLAQTVSNGFLEVNFADPQLEVKLNDFVLTGEGIFPSGFVVGSVIKIDKTQFHQKIIVKVAFDSLAEKFLILKK